VIVDRAEPFERARGRSLRRSLCSARLLLGGGLAKFQDIYANAAEAVPYKPQLPRCSLGDVDNAALPVIAAKRPAIDDAQDDPASVLQVRHADDRTERQGAVRGYEFPLVEDFAIRSTIAIEPWTVERREPDLDATSWLRLALSRRTAEQHEQRDDKPS